MSPASARPHAQLVAAADEPGGLLTLAELSHACATSASLVEAWVAEGIFEPVRGHLANEWRFAGACLRRALTASRLVRDLDVCAQDLALVLDLLAEIDRLRSTSTGQGNP